KIHFKKSPQATRTLPDATSLTHWPQCGYGSGDFPRGFHGWEVQGYHDALDSVPVRSAFDNVLKFEQFFEGDHIRWRSVCVSNLSPPALIFAHTALHLGSAAQRAQTRVDSFGRGAFAEFIALRTSERACNMASACAVVATAGRNRGLSKCAT